MPTTYTDLLRLALQETGENENTWGDIANENTFEIIDFAVAGMSSINVTTGNHTLTTENGTPDEARSAILKFTGSPIANLTVTVPTSTKWYIVHNALSTNYTITFSTGVGTTTSLGQGKIGVIYVDGTNVISVVGPNTLLASNNLSDLTDVAAARTNLGLGPIAVANVGSGLEIDGGGNLNVTLSPADTGDVVSSYRTSKSGWVLLSGGTIGNASSGATLRANADTSLLFALLWDNLSNTVLPIQNSDGTPGTRGVNAATDYAANKRLPVPDWRGRSPVGRDDMGGTPANRVTTVFNGTILGNSGGAETHTLTEAQLAAHTHTTAGLSSTGNVSVSVLVKNAGANDGSTSVIRNSGLVVGTGSGPDTYTTPNTAVSLSVTGTLGTTGSGTAHNNMQPSIITNWFIKL